MLHENLKTLMEQKGITQTDLHKTTGICKASISQYLSGKNTPSPKYIKLIADALECPVDALAVITRRPKQPEPALFGVKLTIADAAKRCEKSKEFISGWLQDGNCPFGYARKGTGEKWDYFIVAARLENYLSGIEL